MNKVRMLEEKHRVEQILSIKTRGAATLVKGVFAGGNSSKIKNVVLAKAGVSIPERCVDANAFIVHLYLNRQPGQKVLSRPFVSPATQAKKESDVFRLERSVRLSYEYDMKRRPVRPQMVKTPYGDVLTYDTVPWADESVAKFAKELFDSRRVKLEKELTPEDLKEEYARPCMKTIADFEEWDDYFEAKYEYEKFDRWVDQLKQMKLPCPRVKKSQVTKDGSVGILKREFLRIYHHEESGLRAAHPCSGSELAALLTEIGLATTSSDVKNAIGEPVRPASVPWTTRVAAVWGRLQAAFPELREKDVFLQYGKLGASG